MALLPVGAKWEVEVVTHPWRKLVADIIIFRRLEDDPNRIKQLYLDPVIGGKTQYRVEERAIDAANALPSFQLPWETLEPLAKALRDIGVDGGGDSKMAGKLEAQAAHLKDLRDIALSFINKSTTEEELK